MLFLEGCATHPQEVAVLRDQVNSSQMQQQQQHPIIGLQSSRPCSDIGIFLMGEFLYWQADQHGFRYAFHNKSPDLTVATAGIEGDWINFDFDWDPGARITLGWNTPHDGWDVLAYWTGYWNRSSETTTVDTNATGLGLVTLWIVNNTTTISTMTSAAARYKLDYNLFDLEVGRSFWISRFLSLRPHLGVMGGWLDQDFNVTYAGDTGAFNPNMTTPAFFTGKSDFRGVGPKVGVHSNWHATRTFSVFGKAAASLLFGEVKARSTQRVTFPATGVLFTLQDLNDKFDELMSCLQLAIGLAWDDCFFNDKIFAGLSISWEATYWPDQFHLSTVDDLFYNNPITLKGITVDAKLAF